MGGGISFINADIEGKRSSLRVVGSGIASLGEGARFGDQVVDLQGDRLLPGLINAHDHLQLNSLPALESTGHWRHAREWVAQVNLRRRSDPFFEAHIAVALNERLLMGGLKNLLSGVTTVAHHDRLYPFLRKQGLPISVLADYGWSHSLYIEGADRVRESYCRTPADWPWMIHLAEGIDDEASNEFEELDRLGCLGPNALIVHGVALNSEQRRRLLDKGAGLVWCPTSNLRLFGRTAEVDELIKRGRAALGTDSRFTGSRDLLCEIRSAGESASLGEEILEALVTSRAAALLRLRDRGSLTVGTRGDLLVVPRGRTVSRCSRSDVRLVVVGGRATYADPEYARLVPTTHWEAVRVDGKPKMLERGLVEALRQSSIQEPGLKIPGLALRSAS